MEGRLGLDSEGQDLRLGAALSSCGAWESPPILQTPFLKARTETSLLPIPQHTKSKGNVPSSRKGRTRARCEACAVAFALHRFSSPPVMASFIVVSSYLNLGRFQGMREGGLEVKLKQLQKVKIEDQG